MKFEEVLPKIKKGLMAKRMSWKFTRYIKWNGKELIKKGRDGFIYALYELTVEDILADDWVMVAGD